jgi:XTP/dITP diphosphohydrolase
MSSLQKVVFATGNKGKLKEVRQIFGNTKIEIISMNELGDIPEIVEDGDTFEDNALKKAKFIYNMFKLPTIADDSGLAIEQLGGEPGVYSARYAGEHCTFDDNNNKVLGQLKDFPEPHNAKFISYAIFYYGNIVERAVGVLRGTIINEKRGGEGFGYDPIFVPEGFDKTLAELSLEEKNKISHRADAFHQLKRILTHIEI